MKSCLILILTVFCAGCAQKTYRLRVLEYPGQPVGNRYDTLAIRRIRGDNWSDSVVVKLRDRRKLVLSPKAVWGYQEVDGSIWRYYGGSFIRVAQLDTPTLYSKQRSSFRITRTHYYFSKSPVSRLYFLSEDNVHRTYTDNPCFLKSLDALSQFQFYESYDYRHKSYLFIWLYRQCEKQVDSSLKHEHNFQPSRHHFGRGG